jgi:DNA-binding NarL/FixJ family response regulator
MIRLLIVGDQPAVRKGLHMVLDAEVDLSVIGEVSDSETVLALATSLCPDIVIIDIDMLHMDGIDMARTLHQLCPQISIIILSLRDDLLTCTRAEDAGATAFVVKSMPTDTLPKTIRQVAHSE